MKRRQQVVREGSFSPPVDAHSMRKHAPFRTNCEPWDQLFFACPGSTQIESSSQVGVTGAITAGRPGSFAGYTFRAFGLADGAIGGDGRPIRVGLVLCEHPVGQQADGGQHEHSNSPPN